jgi:hypothetical protein
LVFIDAPPLMQVAYASVISRLADAVVPVIPHNSTVQGGVELMRRLKLIEATAIGYLYNKAPVRPEMLETGGSMHDILGDQGFASAAPRRPRA